MSQVTLDRPQRSAPAFSWLRRLCGRGTLVVAVVAALFLGNGHPVTAAPQRQDSIRGHFVTRAEREQRGLEIPQILGASVDIGGMAGVRPCNLNNWVF